MKAEFDKLNINKLVNVSTSLNNLKAKVDYLDVDLDDFVELKTVPADLSNAVENEVVKNTRFNTLKTKVNNLHKNFHDATTLIHINQYETDKQNLKKKVGNIDQKIPHVSGLTTTTILNTKISEADNKRLDTSCLVTTTVINTKIGEVENKTLNHDKYITAQVFHNLTTEN